VVLSSFGVRYLQDVTLIMDNEVFEASIRAIPGQRSRINLVYFYMMCGSERHVKPDRMVMRFVSRVLNRRVHVREVQELVSGAAYLLHFAHPNMSPRILDNAIWLSECSR